MRRVFQGRTTLRRTNVRRPDAYRGGVHNSQKTSKKFNNLYAILRLVFFVLCAIIINVEGEKNQRRIHYILETEGKTL